VKDHEGGSGRRQRQWRGDLRDDELRKPKKIRSRPKEEEAVVKNPEPKRQHIRRLGGQKKVGGSRAKLGGNFLTIRGIDQPGEIATTQERGTPKLIVKRCIRSKMETEGGSSCPSKRQTKSPQNFPPKRNVRGGGGQITLNLEWGVSENTGASEGNLAETILGGSGRARSKGGESSASA